VAGASGPGKAKRAGVVATMERGIRLCANSRRRGAGLRPLNYGSGLSDAARRHAHSMARAGFFDHVDPSGRGPADRVAALVGGAAFSMIGENIAAGQPGARSTCRSWMQSEGHRANILNPAFTNIGGGFAMGGPYSRYYVMVLGSHR
jgi:uncharacterized protein YkwD